MVEEIADIVPKRSILIADKGYSSEKIRSKLKKKKIRPVIPYKSIAQKEGKSVVKSFIRNEMLLRDFFLEPVNINSLHLRR